MLTSDVIWAGMMTEPDLAAEPEAIQEVMRSFVDHLPVLLADLLDKPANFQNIIKAKLRFLRYCSENDFIAKYADAMPDDALGFLSRDEFKDMFTGLFADLVEMMEPIAISAADFLKEQGIPEETLMLGDNVGLAGEARNLHMSGNLTIGKLLELQPAIIVRNDK